jgi:hypothetical protein
MDAARSLYHGCLLLLLLLQSADIMVTGTLGLAAPKTRAAMKAAAQMVKAGGGKVGVTAHCVCR